MTKEYCQAIRIAAMAIRDGETPPLPEQEVNRHLESCADCRLDIGQQEQAVDILNGRSRRVFAHNVWPEIAATVEGAPRRSKQPVSVLPFVVLCLFLLTFKIIEVLPSVTAGIAIKLIPVGVLVLFFALIKQNPFEIKQNLRLQGDTR